MSVNFSSTSNLTGCSASNVGFLISTSIVAMKILLLLPLCTFILFLGHHRRRRQSSAKATSHSDLFTYHLAVMEMFFVIGSFFRLGGVYSDHSAAVTVGLSISNTVFFGELFFNVLTCVDRYLAVVHPITYLRLRNTRGIRIRSVIIGFVWLLCFVMTGLYRSVMYNYGSILLLCLVVVAIVVTCFFSMSVLCVLIRPGPGEKERGDHSKRRAFLTITVISCVLWFWFVGILVVKPLQSLQSPLVCVIAASLSLFNLSNSLVLPLLFLHKVGRPVMLKQFMDCLLDYFSLSAS